MRKLQEIRAKELGMTLNQYLGIDPAKLLVFPEPKYRKNKSEQ